MTTTTLLQRHVLEKNKHKKTGKKDNRWLLRDSALVDLDSSGSPGVRPTPGLTSSTEVVCAYVRAYTSTHTHPTLTPAKIEKYTRQNPYLYLCQNTASHARNKH